MSWSRIADKRGSRHRRILAVAALMVLSVSLTTFAASLADYKKRVERARISADELFQNLDAGNNMVFERQAVAEIEKLIPGTERIEWPGGSVETDNEWLGAKLKDFAAETEPDKRAAHLTEISERLLVISETVGALGKTAPSQQTKDADKQKLAEILRREEYQKPQPKGESLFQKWYRRFMEWLASIWPRPVTTPGSSPGLGSLQFGLQILIYALVIGLVGFLIYKFAPFLSRYRRSKKKEKHDRVILGERVSADQSAADLFAEAENLAHEGNPRAAIRKGYIALLCDLGDRKLLRLARHKTNRDYLRDVRRDNHILENMTRLTQNFESNWYGLRVAEQADWEEFRTTYKLAVDRAGSRGGPGS